MDDRNTKQQPHNPKKMQHLTLFAAFSLVLAVLVKDIHAAAPTCGFTNEKTCVTTSSAGDQCAWCTSAAVGSSCMPVADAQSLPSSIFQCEYPKVALKSTACDTVTSQKSCMASSSGSEKCVWCNSAAVGGTCFIESDAHSLPSSVFQCDFQKRLKTTTCDGNTSEKTCMSATSSTGVKCSWCNSAAVGSTCFEETDAKGLPSSVFTCKFQGANRLYECSDYSNESNCLYGWNNPTVCAWCTGTQGASQCLTPEDAKALPPAEFTCHSYGAKALRGN